MMQHMRSEEVSLILGQTQESPDKKHHGGYSCSRDRIVTLLVSTHTPVTAQSRVVADGTWAELTDVIDAAISRDLLEKAEKWKRWAR